MNMSPCDDLFELDLPPNKLLILMAVASGEISVPRIAWKTKYSRPQVWRLVKSLTKDKLLTVSRASLGKNRTLYALNGEAIATWKRKEPYQDDEVDYKKLHQNDEVKPDQPNQPNQNDEVSDSQLDQIDSVDGVEPHQNDGVDIVTAVPPNNPLNTKANTNTALKANALLDLSPEVAQIMALFKTAPPDIEDVKRAVAKFPLENVKRAIIKAQNNPKVHNVWAYASPAFGDELKIPPSVPPVSPSTNDNGFDLRKVQREQMERNARLAREKKASGQS